MEDYEMDLIARIGLGIAYGCLCWGVLTVIFCIVRISLLF